MTTRTVDKLFVRYVRTGDPRALATVFDESAPEILRVARHLAHDEAEAEDLLQEAFLRAIERADSFRPGERVVPWLIGILANGARTRQRKRARHAEAPLPDLRATDDPVRAAHGHDVERRIRDSLAGIPEPYRDVLERHLAHGQSGEQIGRDLGCSPNTVRSRLRRGLRLLRRSLPAGFAVACDRARGLEAVRHVVITRAAANPAAAVTAWNASLLGAWVMWKKVGVVVGAIVVLAAGWWALDPWGADSDGGTLEVESHAETVRLDERVESTDEGAVARTAVRGEAAAAGPDETYRTALTRYHGRVLDSERAPVGGATVELYRIDPFELFVPGEAPAELLAGSAVTAADGTFRFAEVEPRAVAVLRAEHDGLSRLRIVETMPGPGEEVDLGDIELPAWTAVEGLVVDADGEPVVGANVRSIDVPPMLLGLFHVQHLDVDAGQVILRRDRPRVVPLPGWARDVVGRFAFCRAKTGADGRFHLRGVPPGSNAVIVQKDGFTTELRSAVRARPHKTADLGRIRLREGEQAVVRVVDDAGVAVPDAEVWIAPTNSAQPIDFATQASRTDEHGISRREGVPSGRITVAVRRSRAHAWVVADPALVTADVVVRLPVAHELTVFARDPHGAPIDGAGMRIAAGTLGDLADQFPEVEPWLDRDVRAESPGRLVVDDLETGPYVVELTAPGFVPRRVAVDVAARTQESVELHPGAEVVVYVTDARGAPVRHADVSFEPMDGLLPPRRSGRTDAAGRCVIADAPRGEVKVGARHPAFGLGAVQVTWPVDTEVVLPDPGSIAGIVEPVPAPGTVLPRLLVNGADATTNDEPSRMVLVDEAGRFEVHGLTPGEYRVSTMPSLENVRSVGSGLQHFMVASAMHRDPPKHVVRPGEVTRVVVPRSGRELDSHHGTVTIRGSVLVDGAPPRDCQVMVFHHTLDVVPLEVDGTFELTDVAGGSAQLAVVRGRTGSDGTEHTFWRRTLELRGVDQIVEVRLQTGVISGTVVAPEGRSPAGVVVRAAGSLRDTDGARASFEAQTDAQGRFEFAGLPAGIYRIGPRRGDEDGVPSEPIELVAGGRRDGVEVQLR